MIVFSSPIWLSRSSESVAFSWPGIGTSDDSGLPIEIGSESDSESCCSFVNGDCR